MKVCPHCGKDIDELPEFELTGDETPAEKDARLTELAGQIYKEYPLKKGRGAAIKKIKAALRSISYEELLSATKAFAQLWSHRPKHEWKYCPHPATWYHQERWNDEDIPDPEPEPVDVTDEVASLF